MSKVIELDNATVFQGDNREVLKTLADNSIDSIITDPPYELGFMNKKWDSTGIAYDVELWRECLRVLKPGGHLLAFGGSRTWHRLAVAIEDAGFELRDSIAWLYGSGFPKSHNISKAIDKRGGESIGWFGSWLKNWRSENNISQKDIAALFPSKTGNLTGCVANWELGFNLPTAEQFSLICKTFNLPFESLQEAEREVIGTKKKAELKENVFFGDIESAKKSGRAIGYVEFDITAAATDNAKKWDGWGTALKPAFEPIVVARKPLIGTVAENVLEFGTGGLNIDASRIGTEVLGGGTMPNLRDVGAMSKDATGIDKLSFGQNPRPATRLEHTSYVGRWPANIILDEYTAELLDEQTEASRFFYVAKASKRDRNEGLEQLNTVTVQTVAMGNRSYGTLPDGTAREMKPQPRQNFHPTVKPTVLMQYLIKLVTPPNGIVLDPFTGSGSTGKAAILDNYQFIGIELTEEYFPIIEGRLRHAQETLDNKADDLFE